jgi:hypothetical protein
MGSPGRQPKMQDAERSANIQRLGNWFARGAAFLLRGQGPLEKLPYGGSIVNAAFLLISTAWFAGADAAHAPTPAPVVAEAPGGCGGGGCGDSCCNSCCNTCCECRCRQYRCFTIRIPMLFNRCCSPCCDCGCNTGCDSGCGGCGGCCTTCCECRCRQYRCLTIRIPQLFNRGCCCTPCCDTCGCSH